MEDNYIVLSLSMSEEKVENYIDLKDRTPKRIQTIYELSKRIEDISTSSEEDS